MYFWSCNGNSGSTWRARKKCPGCLQKMCMDFDHLGPRLHPLPRYSCYGRSDWAPVNEERRVIYQGFVPMRASAKKTGFPQDDIGMDCRSRTELTSLRFLLNNITNLLNFEMGTRLSTMWLQSTRNHKLCHDGWAILISLGTDLYGRSHLWAKHRQFMLCYMNVIVISSFR
jgi:hypothetical protein